MFRIASTVLCAMLILVCGTVAQAHRTNESYVYFDVTDESLSGRIEARLTDINKAIALDADGDGDITRVEFQARTDEILTYFFERLSVTSNGENFHLKHTKLDFLDTGQGTFALMHFDIPGIIKTPDQVQVRYQFLFDGADPTHAGYALIASNSRTGIADNEAYVSLIFEKGRETQTLSLIGEPAFSIFKKFVMHGIIHIWFGFDHVLFLITLLLPSVLVLTTKGWRPEEKFRDALINVIRIVSVFTVSHTITLGLASLGIVTLNITLVEAVIALSIAVVALNNIIPIYHNRVLWVVFLLGLVHGFGFANVLAPLGVLAVAKTVGLLAFNLGVEIGQIAIVMLVFPVLFFLRRWSLYPFLVLKLGSFGLILMAGIWFIERISGAVYRLMGWI